MRLNAQLPMFGILLLLHTMAVGAESHIGIILMHGKWGSPANVGPLERTLSSKGYMVVTPEMPWSASRNYDTDYPAALAQIDQLANELRRKGAKKIVVGGHSFGANASIAYAGSGYKVDGIMALAPGHTVELPAFDRAVSSSVAKAKAMIEADQADESANFVDLNQGSTRSIRTTAKIYVSYFDPYGIAAMSWTAEKIKTPTPLLWVVGTSDTIYSFGKKFAFNRVPDHPLNRYIVVDGDHTSTPMKASEQILSWLADLANDKPITNATAVNPTQQNLLTAAQINKLIIGNTIQAEELGSGTTYAIYFDVNGKYTHLQGEDQTQGIFRVNANGTHCIKFKTIETCATINDNGDGTYTRIEDGTPKTKWFKAVNGKHL